MKTLNIRIIKPTVVFAVGAALLCGAARAEEPVGGNSEAAEEETPEGWHYDLGEGVSFGEQSIVSGEFELAFDSKYLTYGCVDNNDPVLRPQGSLTFFDWLQFKIEAIYDITKYGKQAGWSNRQWKSEEIDPSVRLAHDFSPEDYEWLPTTVSLELGYMYEYHPRAMGGNANGWGDTQFVWLEASMDDLWLEPYFYYERDIDRDNGTYLYAEIGHTISLIGGKEEGDDPILSIRPMIGQGFGNTTRVRSYLYDENDEPLDHAGLMDTTFRVDLTWQAADNVTVGAYVAYVDFLFDRKIRDASRSYESRGRWEESYNFIGGLSVVVNF